VLVVRRAVSLVIVRPAIIVRGRYGQIQGQPGGAALSAGFLDNSGQFSVLSSVPVFADGSSPCCGMNIGGLGEVSTDALPIAGHLTREKPPVYIGFT
jgi:hypothetical protein